MGDLRPPYRPDNGLLDNPGLGDFPPSETAQVMLHVGEAPDTKTLYQLLGGNTTEGLLQEWLTLFIQKQKDYGDSSDDLGAPGQYAELHRKMGKLKKALWDGEVLAGEQPDEVLFDLIGHCFLAIRHLRMNNYGGKPTK